MSMFKGGFSPCGFASFLVLYGQEVCKCWLSLVSRPYISDIFLILYLNSSLILLKLLCHFYIQAISSEYYCCSERRMNIHIEQIKPHKQQMSISQIITVSLSLIKSGVTIVYIGKEFETIRNEFESPHWMCLYLTN